MIDVKIIVPKTIINGKTYLKGAIIPLSDDEANRQTKYKIVEPVETFREKVETQQSFLKNASYKEMLEKAKSVGITTSPRPKKEWLIKELKNVGIK